MKNIIFLSFIMVCAASCKKDDIMFYEGPDAISIYVDEYESDSTNYSFALEGPEVVQDTVWIKVRVQGASKDVDRTIELESVNGTTAVAGKDFDLPNFTLKAGESITRYPVILHRTSKLLQSNEKLVVAVKANGHFAKGAIGTEINETVSKEKYIIYFNDYLSEPPYWASMGFDSYIGEFSAVKFRFMMSIYGISDFSGWSTGELMNAALNLRIALAEYEAVNGILYDEDGNRITF